MSSPSPKARGLETIVEAVLFASRWLMAPFYLGLAVALAALLVHFFMEMAHFLPRIFNLDENAIIVWVLSLVDLSLAGNLIIMVMFSGYENFVSKMEVANHRDRPDWMGRIDFSGMKLKLIASIVAISAIQLLKAFMEIGSIDYTALTWMVIIHLTFIGSGVLLALMDWMAGKTESGRKA